jgi:hypothetical protein
MFISVSTFCIRWIVLLASATSLPDAATMHAPPRLVARLKAVVQQSEGMQLQQPPALLDVALAARQILGVTRIYQIHLQSPLLQNLENRNPVHSGRLHGHATHSASISQTAIRSISAVKQSKHRTGSGSRSGLIATQCSLPPMSIPAASGCMISSAFQSTFGFSALPATRLLGPLFINLSLWLDSSRSARFRYS